MSNIEPQLFQKPANYTGRGDNISPTTPGNNGTPPLSRNTTPVPPISYQVRGQKGYE